MCAWDGGGEVGGFVNLKIKANKRFKKERKKERKKENEQVANWFNSNQFFHIALLTTTVLLY